MTAAGRRRPGRRVSMADVARLAGVSSQTVSRVSTGHPGVVESTRRQVLAAMARARLPAQQRRPGTQARRVPHHRRHPVHPGHHRQQPHGRGDRHPGRARGVRDHADPGRGAHPGRGARRVHPARRAGRRRHHRDHGGAPARRGQPDAAAGRTRSWWSTPTPATATRWSTPTRPTAPGRPSGTCSTSATVRCGTSPGRPSRSPASAGRTPGATCSPRPAGRSRRSSAATGRRSPATGPGCGWPPSRLHRGLRGQRPDGARRAAGAARARPPGARARSAWSASTTSRTPARTCPPLTTVHQDFAEVGRRCVRALLRQIRDEPVDAGTVLVPTTLIHRQSTAPPP